MKQVTVYCPECNKMGMIVVEENIISESERGITAVNVAEYLVCEHAFIAYIDKNFIVRDSFVCDFKIELPQLTLPEKIEETSTLLKVNIYLLMINISPLSLAYLLKTCLFKKNVCIICNDELVRLEIINLIKNSFGKHLINELACIPRISYKKEKKNFKNHIVIDNDKILNDKNNLINPKDIKVERVIIQKFLAEGDDETSLIIMKSEIEKALTLSETIANFLKSDKVNHLTPDIIKEVIKKKYGISLKNEYLRFLLKISKYFFNMDFAQNLEFIDYGNWMYYMK